MSDNIYHILTNVIVDLYSSESSHCDSLAGKFEPSEPVKALRIDNED
jgi:hypothetical protein